MPSMIVFEIAVPNITITDYLNFFYLFISLKISMNSPPLSEGTAKVVIFSYSQNILNIFFNITIAIRR